MLAVHLLGCLHLWNMEAVEIWGLGRLCRYLQSRHLNCDEVFGNLLPNIATVIRNRSIQNWVFFFDSVVDTDGDFREIQIWRDVVIFPANATQSVMEVWRFSAINVDARKGPCLLYASNNICILVHFRRMGHSILRN